MSVTLFSFCIIFVCLFHRLEYYATRKICLINLLILCISCRGWRYVWGCRVIVALIRFIILVDRHQLRRTISTRWCLINLLSLLGHLFLIATRGVKSSSARDWAVFCLIAQVFTFRF